MATDAVERAHRLVDQAKRIVATWLSTPFESGGRHERRVRQIVAIERNILQKKVSRRRAQGPRL